MVRMDTITLIKDNPTAHGVFDTRHSTTERTVFAEILSVSRSEFYSAHNNGLQPSYVFKLADEAEYDDELTCIYKGKQYRIIRTYVNSENGIELTVERSDT